MTEPSHLTITRTAYDTVAADYHRLVGGILADNPVDRAVLALFAELVTADGGGDVADIGCGTGRITAHLHTLGLTAFGIDLSPGMLAVAREHYPHLSFRPGSLLAIDLPEGHLAGALAWYSIIHTPRAELPTIIAELHRVLRPGGHLLLAFQTGDFTRHITNAYGHDITLDAHRLPTEHLITLLTDAGFALHSQLIAQPRPVPYETTPQTYLIATKPAQHPDLD